jgi:O-antigen ligase
LVLGPSQVRAARDELRAPPPPPALKDPAERLGTLSSARYGLWKAAIDIHSSHPWHGVGPGAFEFAWNRNPEYDHFVRDAHSLYLESLAEMGWLGFASILLFVGGLASVGARLRVGARGDPVAAGLLASLLAAFVVFLAYAGYDWMWESTAVAVFALAIATVALAGSSQPLDRRLRLPVRATLAVVALLIAMVQLPGLVATSKIRSSQQAASAGHLGTALGDAEDAVASAPWAASPYVQRALLLERSGRLGDARTDILRAERREPTNYRHPLLLARIEALRGRVRPALQAFRTARSLAPKKTIVAGGPAISAPPPE